MPTEKGGVIETGLENIVNRGNGIVTLDFMSAPAGRYPFDSRNRGAKWKEK